MDEIADLADRAREMSEFEFAIEWGSLTAAEQDEFMALMDQRCARGEEKLEAIEEDNRILKLLFAYQQGAITAVEFVKRVRGAVPEPSAGLTDREQEARVFRVAGLQRRRPAAGAWRRPRADPQPLPPRPGAPGLPGAGL